MDDAYQKKEKTIYKIPEAKVLHEAAVGSVDEKFLRYDMARFFSGWQKRQADKRLDEQTVKKTQGSKHEFDFDR